MTGKTRFKVSRSGKKRRPAAHRQDLLLLVSNRFEGKRREREFADHRKRCRRVQDLYIRATILGILVAEECDERPDMGLR
ncbi:MAG: hypothetical protein JSV70_01320 [bacterium]|nr:MAG: hypothetical protein JSV70_01320 [bacterium]